MSTSANSVTLPLAQYSPKHFLLAAKDGVAVRAAGLAGQML